jgi:uncharacterized protein (DUF488 family)
VFFSIGHSSLTQEEFLLLTARLDLIVDVRSHPASRHSPHFDREELERWLPQAGIAYEWLPALGGWRPHPDRTPDGDIATAAPEGALVSGGWRNQGFENYAWAISWAGQGKESRAAEGVRGSLWGYVHRSQV